MSSALLKKSTDAVRRMAEALTLVFRNCVPLGQLLERFPRAMDAGEGKLIAACPFPHEGMEGEIKFTETPDGWELSSCDMGSCLPGDVWRAAHVIDQEEPGSDREPTPAKTRFRLERATDLLLEEIPSVRWLLAPYVPAASFGELVGPPGKGKTTFMAWMISQMASAGYRCTIIEEEGSRGGLQRLLKRALGAVGPEAAANVSFLYAQGVSLLSAEDVAGLAVVLAGQDFVLLDSFAMVTPGLDEDKAQALGPVVTRIKWLRDALGAAIWLNHHSGKSKWKPGEVPRLGDGRGSSALPGALDAELSMRPIEKPEEGFIQFDLFVTKMREGDDQVRPQRVSIARNGPAAILEMFDTERQAPPEVDAHLTLSVLDFIKSCGDNGCSKNLIEKNVKGDTNAKRLALSALKYAGQVEEIPAGNYTKWRVR